jgi:hypothetical protein
MAKLKGAMARIDEFKREEPMEGKGGNGKRSGSLGEACESLGSLGEAREG